MMENFYYVNDCQHSNWYNVCFFEELSSDRLVATFENGRHAEAFTKWLNREWTLIPKTVDEICSETFNNTSSHGKERENE